MKTPRAYLPSCASELLDPIGGVLVPEEYLLRLLAELRLGGETDLADVIEREVFRLLQPYRSRPPVFYRLLMIAVLRRLRVDFTELAELAKPAYEACAHIDLQWAIDQFGRERVAYDASGWPKVVH